MLTVALSSIKRMGTFQKLDLPLTPSPLSQMSPHTPYFLFLLSHLEEGLEGRTHASRIRVPVSKMKLTPLVQPCLVSLTRGAKSHGVRLRLDSIAETLRSCST